MKKLLLIAGTILILFGCQKQKEADQPVDKWNGYESFFKSGAITKTLWAGQHHNIGTVTYEFTVEENGIFFNVTYNTSAGTNSNGIDWESGWWISETHMQASLWADFPLNKKDLPKIGLFDYYTYNNPMVQNVLYHIDVNDLPNYDDSGFIVATHAIVKKGNQTETAWGGWDDGCDFADRGWGGYSNVYYQPSEEINILAYDLRTDGNGGLSLTMLNFTDGSYEPNMGDGQTYSGGPIDGIAWDAVSTDLFFASNNTGGTSSLYTYPMNEGDNYLIGTLDGIGVGEFVKSGSFYDGEYYYLNNVNEIWKVTFTTDENGYLVINTDTQYETITGTTANEMAITGTGTIYILGENNGQTTLGTAANVTQFTLAIPTNSSLVYGADELVYTFGGGFVTSINPTTGTNVQTTPIDIGGGVQPVGLGGGLRQ